MTRRFTVDELRAIEEDALNAELGHSDDGHWLGLVIDLARALREESNDEDRRTGRWFREFFSLKFMAGNLPGPRDALYGSRLRVQIDTKDGDWEDWHR